MTASSDPGPAVSALSATPTLAAREVDLWAGLLDDAALFPPGDAPMRRAVPAHRRHRLAPYAPLVGPSLVPAARLNELAELTAVLDDVTEALDVGIIAPVELLADVVSAVTANPTLTLAGVEVSPSATSAGPMVAAVRAAVPDNVPVAVELPRDARRASVLDALAPTSIRAKLRTGGTQAAAFPPDAELSAAISGCRDRGIAFKATAGLHHAVRHPEPETGFTQHGYLNLLVAADTAARGGGPAEITAALAERNVDAVVAAAAAMAPGSPRFAAARTLFASFGTCSIQEPIADLVNFGLLGATAPETTP